MSFESGSNGYQILESTSPTGPFTVAPSNPVGSATCPYEAQVSLPAGSSFGQPVYFEVEGKETATSFTAPSNVISATIPAVTGATGPLTLSLFAYIDNALYGNISWSTPVLGYRLYSASTTSGPFTLYDDTGPAGLYVSIVSYIGPGAAVGCWEVQGYSQAGTLGPVSTPACFP